MQFFLAEHMNLKVSQQQQFSNLLRTMRRLRSARNKKCTLTSVRAGDKSFIEPIIWTVAGNLTIYSATIVDKRFVFLPHSCTQAVSSAAFA
jgi:hypothetical protein